MLSRQPQHFPHPALRGKAFVSADFVSAGKRHKAGQPFVTVGLSESVLLGLWSSELIRFERDTAADTFKPGAA